MISDISHLRRWGCGNGTGAFGRALTRRAIKICWRYQRWVDCHRGFVAVWRDYGPRRFQRSNYRPRLAWLATLPCIGREMGCLVREPGDVSAAGALASAMMSAAGIGKLISEHGIDE